MFLYSSAHEIDICDRNAISKCIELVLYVCTRQKTASLIQKLYRLLLNCILIYFFIVIFLLRVVIRKSTTLNSEKVYAFHLALECILSVAVPGFFPREGLLGAI